MSNSCISSNITVQTGNNQLDDKIIEWIQWDQNSETRNALLNLLSSKKYDHLNDILFNRLSFGTAGIRGPMGQPGYLSMNDLVLIQTSQGLASYLIQFDSSSKTKGVVIGYDGRHNSKRFAQLTANAFLAKDIPVCLFSQVVPTPFVPFAVKLLKLSAGIMITASHNPKQDNGYKVYFSNGAQITSPHDKNIQQEIFKNLKPWANAWDLRPENHPKCKDQLNFVSEQYYKEIRIFNKEQIQKSDLKITYTSLHGVSHPYISKAFSMCGFNDYYPVECQKDPDPEFSTVDFPNPEEGKGVLNESFKTAKQTGSTLIIANDPDADRCAIAELQLDGQWKVFTGNEIGSLLGWWEWFKHKQSNSNIKDSDCYMISTAVSSKLLKSMAKIEGFNFIETLTGFKWMGNKAYDLISKGKTVLFAYEEAIGFMIGTSVLDKDGITTGINVAQLAVYFKSTGQLLTDQLNQIYKLYGFHYSITSYFICYEQSVIKAIFDRLANFNGQNSYLSKIGSFEIIRVRDLNRGFDSGTNDHIPELPTSKSSFMLTLYFKNGFVLTIRTSGTEPKIKYYAEAISSPENSDWESIKNELNDMINEMVKVCLEPEKNGLKPKKD